MKKILGFIIVFLMVFSVSSFSIDKPSKKKLSVKTEQLRKKNPRAGVKPRSKGGKNFKHRPKIQKQSRKVPNNMIKF
jgi:hypothetical protein